MRTRIVAARVAAGVTARGAGRTGPPDRDTDETPPAGVAMRTAEQTRGVAGGESPVHAAALGGVLAEPPLRDVVHAAADLLDPPPETLAPTVPPVMPGTCRLDARPLRALDVEAAAVVA